MRQSSTRKPAHRNFSVRVPRAEADAFERLAKTRERAVAAELRRLIRRELKDAA